MIHLSVTPTDLTESFCGRMEPGDTAAGHRENECTECSTTFHDYVEALERLDRS